MVCPTKTFAIGDIHGCLNALERVVDAANITEIDQLVLLGDYIDRGPDSRGVLEWIATHQNTLNLICLRGNHEIMMLNAREDLDKFFMWQHFGGEETLDSYGIEDDPNWIASIPETHWHLLQHTQRFYETEKFIFVHAGVAPRKDMEAQNDSALFWKKYPKPKAHFSKKTVICGHTAQADGKVSNFSHTICIDTYAYGGQWLTCLDVNSGQFWQANQDGEIRTDHLLP